MSFNGTAANAKLSMLSKVLDEYCEKAGIPADHPAREAAGYRIMKLFASGMEEPEEFAEAMNTGYDEWLGEVDVPRHYTPAAISTHHVEPTLPDGTVPGSNLRGKKVRSA